MTRIAGMTRLQISFLPERSHSSRFRFSVSPIAPVASLAIADPDRPFLQRGLFSSAHTAVRPPKVHRRLPPIPQMREPSVRAGASYRTQRAFGMTVSMVKVIWF